MFISRLDCRPINLLGFPTTIEIEPEICALKNLMFGQDVGNQFRP